MVDPTPLPSPLPRGMIKRRTARLVAVQILYSQRFHTLADTDAEAWIAAFEAGSEADRFWHLDVEEDNRRYTTPDRTWLAALLTGCTTHQKYIDSLLKPHLSDGRPLNRLDSLIYAILRSAIYELAYCEGIPFKVIITEYMHVARAFYTGEQLDFVNAVLDRIAHQLRENS